MLVASLTLVHLLGVVLWVGGMAFMQFFLRPAVQVLPPPERLALMDEVLRRFLFGAGLAVLAVLGSGIALIALGARGAQVNAMAALGVAMVVIYGRIRFAQYPRFVRALQAHEPAAAAAALAVLRRWVAVNLALGALVITLAMLRPL